MIDETHDANRRSWVASANGHSDFPIQNLPLGSFRPKGGERRGGVAIGDFILDLGRALTAGLFQGEAEAAARAAAGPVLNPLLALPPEARRALRRRLGEILDAKGPAAAGHEALAAQILHPAAHCAMELPAAVGGYTDFYAGVHHALAVGKLFRPDNPLLPNYKHVPIAYHGRTSTLRVSGAEVRRPNGQRKRPEEAAPSFGPCRNLDYELELGIWIGAGNADGKPIRLPEAHRHIAGLCLLNDWSARDIQAWEYQPLGPFLAKNFTTTISPWLVTAEALAPFRAAPEPRPPGDPEPLDYLRDAGDAAKGAFDIALEVLLRTPKMAAAGVPAERLARGTTRDLYWTVAQMVTHHTSGGCVLAPGDLFGSGTISGREPGSQGSLLEMTKGAREPLTLASGEKRGFLEDGDEVIFRAACRREGFASIGFGECRGTIRPFA